MPPNGQDGPCRTEILSAPQIGSSPPQGDAGTPPALAYLAMSPPPGGLAYRSVPGSLLTLTVSTSICSRAFSESRSRFRVSSCCSCISSSASYSRLPSWNSRSSSWALSTLRAKQGRSWSRHPQGCPWLRDRAGGYAPLHLLAPHACPMPRSAAAQCPGKPEGDLYHCLYLPETSFQ